MLKVSAALRDRVAKTGVDMNRITIHSGPDEKGKYVFTRQWDDPDRAGCLTCGADKQRGCKCFNERTTRGQVFRAVHPKVFFENLNGFEIVEGKR